jgi:hypothetical protein
MADFRLQDIGENAGWECIPDERIPIPSLL